MAYMGSTVSYGRGDGVVVSTGMKTEVGKIAGIIQSTEEGETPLQKRFSQLSKILTVLVLGICVLIFGVRILSAWGSINPKFIVDSFMLAVALAVAAIPEGLVAVVTIVLSIGVTKMAKRNAIVRRLTAVEALGCTQIICSDKTGTLTQNKMTVVDQFGDEKLLAESMYFCNDVETGVDGKLVGDPTQLAQKEYGLRRKPSSEKPRVGEIPFDSVRKMMTTINSGNGKFYQYTTGASDEVLNKCTTIFIDGEVKPLTKEYKDRVLAENSRMADKALRVLGGAAREYSGMPADISSAALEQQMTFLGLIGMIDPVRPEVKAAVDECRSSGIKVVMITGDHKETAIAIAKELEIIESAGEAMTGRELEALSDEEFEKRIESTFVYARVQPDHKVRIVNMWKKKGYVTAMTGDGVNDAPAIKSGDIGIGMGITGTDVTKNVADMVLADDNFATIVAAVEEGRRIYDNIRKTLQFLLSTNLSEILCVLTASLMGFIMFKPVHLLFINLITDTVPAVALGMEHAEPDVMERKPRGEKDSIFSDNLGFNTIYQGIVIGLLTLAAYFIVDIWDGHEVAMTAAFFTLSICEICQAFTMRSIKRNIFTLKTHNLVLWGALAFSLALALLVIYVPFLSAVFSLAPLTFKEIVVCLALAASVIPMFETVKAVQRVLERKRDAVR